MHITAMKVAKTRRYIFFFLSVLVNMEGGVAKVGERKSPHWWSSVYFSRVAASSDAQSSCPPCATVGDLCVTNSSHVPDFK